MLLSTSSLSLKSKSSPPVTGVNGAITPPDETLEPDPHSDPVQAWRAFINYVVKFCGNGFMIANLSILVNRNTPLAWKVTGQPLEPFYTDIDKGDTMRQWGAFVRHIISRCAENNGFAVLSAEHVLIHDGRPLMWVETGIKKIHPLSATNPSQSGEEIVCSILYPQYIRSRPV